MQHFPDLLSGGDLRSIGRSNEVIRQVTTQAEFDDLWTALYLPDRLVVMRAADALEKISLLHPEWLLPHRMGVFQLFQHARYPELKWHLALLAPRFLWPDNELATVWATLSNWLTHPEESKIVRVNALQALYDLLAQAPQQQTDFERLVLELTHENSPSLQARLRHLHLNFNPPAAP